MGMKAIGVISAPYLFVFVCAWSIKQNFHWQSAYVRLAQAYSNNCLSRQGSPEWQGVGSLQGTSFKNP